MSSEPIPPPPIDKQAEDETLSTPVSSSASTQQTSVVIERPHIHFSFVQWASKGAVRLSYRAWTRIAVHLFPENSRSEKIARSWHIPLPDKLNLSWVNSHLAVGGRVRPEDIKALGRAGITHVVDTRSEYCDDVKRWHKRILSYCIYQLPILIRSLLSS